MGGQTARRGRFAGTRRNPSRSAVAYPRNPRNAVSSPSSGGCCANYVTAPLRYLTDPAFRRSCCPRKRRIPPVPLVDDQQQAQGRKGGIGRDVAHQQIELLMEALFAACPERLAVGGPDKRHSSVSGACLGAVRPQLGAGRPEMSLAMQARTNAPEMPLKTDRSRQKSTRTG